MQPAQDQIEQSPTSEQHISPGTSNLTEREQRLQRRNPVENVSHAANSNTDVTNSFMGCSSIGQLEECLS